MHFDMTVVIFRTWSEHLFNVFKHPDQAGSANLVEYIYDSFSKLYDLKSRY